MKLYEGRSGTQEIACLVGLSSGVVGLFGIDSMTLYANGNTSFISIPVAIILMLAVSFLAMTALNQQGGVSQGNVFTKLAAILQVILLVLSGITILMRFTDAIHYYIYARSQYEAVLVWILLTILLIDFLGFETVSRTARCLGIILAIVLIATLLIATGGSEPYRLSPFPGKRTTESIKETILISALVLPGTIALMFFPKSANGFNSALRGTIIGVFVAAALVAASQFVLGMAYTYTELENLYMPLYELNMILPDEGYFMRYDKLLLFVWLIGAVVTCAFYTYSASNILCRVVKGSDVKPNLVAVLVVIGTVVLLYEKNAWAHKFVESIMLWGCAALIAMLLGALIVGKLMLRRKNEKAA